MSHITTVFAPAKLNLFLHVTGRRPDGYHLLESVFTLIDLCDTLHFEVNVAGNITRSNYVENVAETQDLTIRAAFALRHRAIADGLANATACGTRIGIEKRIPMGGGLGGGSSDAATTLKTLNKLWGFNYPNAILAEIGLKLGADVPFFIFGQNAFAQGVGEQLCVADLPNFAYLLIKPDAHVPTPAIFAAPELTRATKTITILDFSGVKDDKVKNTEKDAVLSFNATDLAGFKNDLQDVVINQYPAVAEALALLHEVSSKCVFPARMTGSGACIFAAFTHIEHAWTAQQQWQKRIEATSSGNLVRAKTFVVKSLSSNIK
jgi:4-diphosphocytidyl-2-C-methyl-D-erythritol kinase